ncbi:MAG: hypothetical protein K2J63_06660 [Muribaculaceae bacterium]|nr:hypothetical protein [Muribaculaceae bacterium]MDE6337770.1 hypothetical protein [Muribaculaceae bacterium]MDE6794971.1 hypothetical protein [Muribaculaceae bacterium]
MSEVQLILLQEGEGCTIYTLHFIGDEKNEFEKFVEKVKVDSELNSDFRQIVRVLERIGHIGAMERYFRPEGKFKDSIVALPINKTPLRLYCIRLTDKILILGNGGRKTTRTYNEDEVLQGYVITLQKFEKLLKEEETKGNIKITEHRIETDKLFDL